MGHNSAVSSHSVSTSFSQVDGWLTDPRFLGRHSLFIQVAGKQDEILLRTSRPRQSKESEVEVVHVHNRRLPLVEGAPTVNDLQGAL